MQDFDRKGGLAGMLLGASASMVLALAPCLASAQADNEAMRDRIDTALQSYERCHWDDAFAQFAGLADAGHPAAARIAFLMQAHGPRLFAARFGVAADRRARWLDAAAREQPTAHSKTQPVVALGGPATSIAGR